MGTYVGFLAAALLAFALAYNVGMATVENDPQPFVQSLKAVLVHVFTTGYAGGPSSGAMSALVALMSLAGRLVVSVGVIAAVVLGIRELSSVRTRA
ncbi:hypothetical protein BRD00_06170 [Halobacteriales archaeon QS_8_69_26]|nr:MAG: hypothetical protein BRD00_06170 [Halobacteriales archaeon QS_8_69_26]